MLLGSLCLQDYEHYNLCRERNYAMNPTCACHLLRQVDRKQHM